MRAGGAVLLLLSVLALAVVGGMVWWLEVALPRGAATRMERQLEIDTRETGQAIQRRARDGTLTDEDLKAISPQPWTIRRTDHEIRVAMAFLGSKAEYQCWSFTLKTPLGPGAAVTTQRDETACGEPH
ncbi:hypothetical protein ACFWAR_00510 [Streptomyces sp. NPDC059917]|uniref:hypothetical protein n=1 Tax=Streptomyces sp. NPDC059917 TaxID=3347002 RepID=UPI00366A3B61